MDIISMKHESRKDKKFKLKEMNFETINQKDNLSNEMNKFFTIKIT